MCNLETKINAHSNICTSEKELLAKQPLNKNFQKEKFHTLKAKPVLNNRR